MSNTDEPIKNQRIAEYFFLSLLIGLGTPVAIIWGTQDGEQMAMQAYPKAQAAPVNTANAKDVFLPTPANIEMGQALFQNNCVACHGEKADGKGPAAVALTPPPRNFTDPKARWTRSREPSDIFKTVSEGSPGTGMVGFSSALSKSERWALVHYIGSLPGVTGQYHSIDDALAEKLSQEKP